MNKKDVVFIRREAILTDKEKETVLSLVNRSRLDMGGRPMMEIKRKKDLKSHRVLAIRLVVYDLKTMIGLVDVNVDDKSGELTGIRVLRYCGKYEFEKLTFYLKDYKKKWQAWGKAENYELR